MAGSRRRWRVAAHHGRCPSVPRARPGAPRRLCPRDPTLRDVRFRPRGWVALCDGDGVRPADARQVNFFHTSTSRRLRFRLPELHGHRIVGFTDGLLILLNKSTTVVRVLHPFTRAFLDLPPLAPVFHLLVKDSWSRAWMDAAVCWSYASIAVVAWFPNVPVVVYTKPTHARWLVIHRDLKLWTALPFQGRLFGIRKGTGQIVQVYPRHLQHPVVACVPNNFGRPQ
uniref:KIB1-4 beta-propeller domain-containing protein n=1 Tax=Setaria italica TaxID=4555 RepID=K4A1D0_SETIT